MAKVTKEEKRGNRQIEITYDKWPDDGEAQARIEEWENGEGFEVWLDKTKIELTLCEYNALVALFGLRFCKL